LEGARFTRCRIIRARFAHADLREAVFEDCTFVEASEHVGAAFAFSQLDHARFVRCDLSFSKFDRSSLYDVALEDCNLRGAVFNRADFARNFGRNVVRASARFLRCNFHLTELAEARLPGCDFTGSHFREADLSGTDLEGANFSGADLFGALFAGAKLAGADLRGAEVSGLDITQLASHVGLKIDIDQQYPLLTALGVDVAVKREG